MKLPSVFGDHMVLQRDRGISVWGWAICGEQITVTIAGQTRRTVSDRYGKWRVRLPALPAGGPFEMAIRGRQTVTFRDVMIGEVWVCSGQSNMKLPLERSSNAEEEIARANHSQIRLFTVAERAVVESTTDVTGSWQVCSPATVGAFSAVGYHFGRKLIAKLRVPIGLISASWGGTPVEAWASRESLVAHRRFKPMIVAYENSLKTFERRCGAYEAKVKAGEIRYYPRDPGNVGYAAGWAAEAKSVNDWSSISLPQAWQRAGLNFSGVVWFRRTVEVPATWAGRDLILNLGPCDKHDTTYFNSMAVGGMGPEKPDAWGTPRVYRIPGRLVKAGLNVIAVRVYSYVFLGGMLGSPSQMSLRLCDSRKMRALPLAGPWQYRVEHDFGPIPPLMPPQGPGNSKSPYSLYRGMIEPLVPYGIRGVIWYQGEANTDAAYEYRALFPLLIRGWRKAWRQGQFPFLFVQLANHFGEQTAPVNSPWAELREAQTLALKLPNTGMAVAIDIGEADNIHPRNKREVGGRLALQALNRVYGFDKIVPSGPLYKSARWEGRKTRVAFEHIGKGLTARGGRLAGFTVAGSDRKFQWADARIEGRSVVVWNDQVPHPVAVRYGWADNPICNLYNKNGLPACPFRTDRWPGLTKPAIGKTCLR